MHTRIRFAVSGALLCLLPAAFAQQAAPGQHFEGAAQQITYRCEPGQNVHIEGAGNVATLEGDCGTLTIEGAGNRVRAQRLRAMDVQGANNEVLWSAKEAPKVLRNEGAGNRLRRTADQ